MLNVNANSLLGPLIIGTVEKRAPGRTSIQGLLLIENKVLHLSRKRLDFLVFSDKDDKP